MNLSNYPIHILISMANDEESTDDVHDEWSIGYSYLPDEEIDIRKPDEAEVYLGDCAGRAIFLPVQPEHDSNGQPIIKEMIGLDSESNEVWLNAI